MNDMAAPSETSFGTNLGTAKASYRASGRISGTISTTTEEWNTSGTVQTITTS